MGEDEGSKRRRLCSGVLAGAGFRVEAAVVEWMALRGDVFRLLGANGIPFDGTRGALVAAMTAGGDADIAAELAFAYQLVPRQHTTGGKPRLLGISRRGNAYLRQLFIHGARAAMPSLSKAENPMGAWLRGLLARAHPNVAVVALAAKLARIAWATLRHGTTFVRQSEMAAA